MLRASTLTVMLLGLFAAASAQDKGVRGDWRTPGGAVVQIAPCGTELCATLIQSEPNAPGTVDAENPDLAKRSRKLCGLQIGYGFQLADPDHADGGHLYDPKSGKTYRGAMTSDGDKLSLRGYVGIKAFGRTEMWSRTTQVVKPCS